MISELQEKKKFYTCRYDRTFKEVFLKKENEDLLITLLEFTLDLKIFEIQRLNIETLQGNIGTRKKYCDLLLKTDQGYIGIEINSERKDYLHCRNLAFLCNVYSRYTLTGEMYSEDTLIIQLNLTYGMLKNDAKICRTYMLTDGEKNFVRNFKIVEWNMDKVLNYWYAKDEVNIEKFKYLIMLDLNEEDLAKLPRDRKVIKFMNEVKRVNEDPEFFSYMTKEEDDEKCRMTELKEAIDAGIDIGKSEGKALGKEEGKKEAYENMAKEMLKRNIPMNDIISITNLSKEEILKLKETMS